MRVKRQLDEQLERSNRQLDEQLERLNKSTTHVPEPRVPSARTLRAIESQRWAQTDTTPSIQATEIHEPRVPSEEVRRAAEEGIKELKKKVAAITDPAPIARRTRSHDIKPAEPVASRTRSQIRSLVNHIIYYSKVRTHAGLSNSLSNFFESGLFKWQRIQIEHHGIYVVALDFLQKSVYS